MPLVLALVLGPRTPAGPGEKSEKNSPWEKERDHGGHGIEEVGWDEAHRSRSGPIPVVRVPIRVVIFANEPVVTFFARRPIRCDSRHK